jgi:hypothetical protein
MARVNILEFYNDPNLRITTRKHKDDWKKTEAELEQLKSWRPVAAQAAFSQTKQAQ